MDSVPIGKMSIAAERHITQIIEQLFICSHREIVEDCSQLYVLSSGNIHCDSIALFRGSRGMEPVRSRKLYAAAFQVGVGDLLMLLGRHLILHGRVTDFRDR